MCKTLIPSSCFKTSKLETFIIVQVFISSPLLLAKKRYFKSNYTVNSTKSQKEKTFKEIMGKKRWLNEDGKEGWGERKTRVIQLWVITGIKHCRREEQGKWIWVGVGRSIWWNQIFPRCTAEVLTWSPGWGLIRETWSYPRRNRAQIASSLPWTGPRRERGLTAGHIWPPNSSKKKSYFNADSTVSANIWSVVLQSQESAGFNPKQTLQQLILLISSFLSGWSHAY